MSETITVENWRHFEAEIQKLRQQYEGKQSSPSQLLYRGQSNAAWKLESSLDRSGNTPMRVHEYYHAMHKTQSVVETFTDGRWPLPDLMETIRDLSDYDTTRIRQFPDQDTYAYMVYLRHHGFPSPLLDWTSSHQIAAFFAFRYPTDAPLVSIYVYSERPNNIKVGGSDRPNIHRHGPYVRSHRRHFLQQSSYTTCVHYSDKHLQFVPHELVFAAGSKDQDVIWKFDLPSEERISILEHLDVFNLNAYSLFGSEDTLLETIAFREQRFRHKSSPRIATVINE